MNNNFDPSNEIVKMCIKAMALERENKINEAKEVYLNGFLHAKVEMEKVITAHFLGKIENDILEKIKWFEIALKFAKNSNDVGVRSTLWSHYNNIAMCNKSLGDFELEKEYSSLAEKYKNKINELGVFYHGTKADLNEGDFLIAGFGSNYKDDITMNHIYFTALVNGAGLAASLAKGDGVERVYIVEPTGDYENDPNVTDKKFPGNLTRSYRSVMPLKIIGEVKEFNGQSKKSKEEWAIKLKANKGEIIN